MHKRKMAPCEICGENTSVDPDAVMILCNSCEKDFLKAIKEQERKAQYFEKLWAGSQKILKIVNCDLCGIRTTLKIDQALQACDDCDEIANSEMSDLEFQTLYSEFGASPFSKKQG